jgi:hypothetical protein
VTRGTIGGALATAVVAVLTVSTPPAAAAESSPIHTRITATVFWIGEPQGNGSSENNALSAWDDSWLAHYGGVDDPNTLRRAANDYFPAGFTPKENPFYVDLPYDDFDDGGVPRPSRLRVVPWARRYAGRIASFEKRGRPFSIVKNHWVKLMRNGKVCYAQWEDTGPYVYDDAAYVFGRNDPRPRSRVAQNAGMDVSPAVRDCLAFHGFDNADNALAWQFVAAATVPPGPWRKVITTRQVSWH